MPEFIEVPVEGGEGFLMEVDRGAVRIGRGDDAVAAAKETFQRSLDRVRVIAGVVVDKLSDLPRQPDRVRVEFGVKLSADANVIVTRTTGEAHFVVELEWTREPSAEKSDAKEVGADG
ncbi:hypothetical protein J5X84_39685 [Streptosporangiaceae bacterium NEAU-GS5]|nr:hypothetical protein [Streptosporangiaceae bacterium NEAU-GS5]